MNMTPTDEVVLKQDVLGRVKTPTARREQILDEFERSGLPGLKFAELIGIKYQTFATWAQKRRRQRGDYAKLPAVKKKVRWLEAVVGAAQSRGDKNPLPLILTLPGGARLEISDAQQVEMAAALLRALQPPC
jgi:hypothetical protein